MKIREFVQQKWWRNLMGYLYSWGASVVMIGALMKLEHFPLSSYFLIAGLGTEAIIFFFSGFEPLPEDWEWDRVYPELADKNANVERKIARPAVAGSAAQRFDELLAKAEITPELFTRLGNGMTKLADSTSKMSEITTAHIETQQFTSSIKKASENLSSFGEAYQRATAELNQSASSLTTTYNQTADLVGKLSASSNHYNEQLEKMNKNLAALNSVYELQLRGEDEHLKTSKALYQGLDSMIENLNASVQNTKQYREEVDRLGKRVAALNKVYGNMLTAMNVTDNN